MRFIDLFAGLGGFHLALRRLHHVCVFACEIDPVLQETYRLNFGITPAGDIRSIRATDVPAHDLLCAGFPCQPFSKAGEQAGLECDKWGNLFNSVSRILRHHRPRFVILENVANLERHDGGRTWKARLHRRLVDAGYDVDAKLLSPHQFGIPQIRERFFVVASRAGLGSFVWPDQQDHGRLSIESVLDRQPPEATRLSSHAISCLETWQAFLEAWPAREELPSFPIWSMEFGATYPFENATPLSAPPASLESARGSHGRSLAGLSGTNLLDALPSHARTTASSFPRWKETFIRQNRELYQRHRRWIDPWIPRIKTFPSSLQKLEWNCKGEKRDIWSTIVQFRASGVRVKRPTTAPSLVAMTTTQVPVIAWERRYMTPRECSRLQSMEELAHLPGASTRAFKALGNSVNVDVVQRVAEGLLPTSAQLRGKQLTRVSVH